MKPFSKILVPVDFSEPASEAIRYAADLSRRYDASVTLVHVYQPAVYTLPESFMLYTPVQVTQLLSEFERQLELTRLEAQAAGAARVDSKMLQGVAASEIVDFAAEHGHDLIVMGTHGRTGLEHVVVGSVTERVVRKAPCPVLTVRAQQP